MTATNIITSVNPKVRNWDEVKEQFGIIREKGSKHKSAFEIYKELVFANQRFDIDGGVPSTDVSFKSGLSAHLGGVNTRTLIFVEYEEDNIDSGICMFDYMGMEGQQRVYEFSGTAK